MNVHVQGDSCLLAASGDQTIRAWSVMEGKRLNTFAGHTASVKSVGPSPHHPCVFASGNRDAAQVLSAWCNENVHGDDGPAAITLAIRPF